MSTVASVDWFSVTAWLKKENGLTGMDIVEWLGLTGMVKKNYGARGYRSVHRNDETGAALYESPYEMKTGEHFNLELSGGACGLVLPDKWKMLMVHLEQNFERWHITRLDMALDTDLFTTNTLASSIVAGNYKTRVSPKNIQRIHDLAGDGDTIYVGSKQNTAHLRMYKKQIEEHSIFNNEWFTRLELQLRDERADGGYKLLAMTDFNNWPMVMGSSINDFFSIEENYWAGWMQEVPSGSLVKIKHPEKTLKRTTKWLNEQVAPSLAMYFSALTDNDSEKMFELLIGMMVDGSERWSASHRQAMKNYELDKSQNTSKDYQGVYIPVDFRAFDAPENKILTAHYDEKRKEKLLEKRLDWWGLEKLRWSEVLPENERFGLGDTGYREYFTWVLDAEKYQEELAALAALDFEEVAIVNDKAQRQLELFKNDSTDKKSVNHYDVP